MEEEILGKGGRPGTQALNMGLSKYEAVGGEKVITTSQLLCGLQTVKGSNFFPVTRCSWLQVVRSS